VNLMRMRWLRPKTAERNIRVFFAGCCKQQNIILSISQNNFSNSLLTYFQ
jgi:hypothetical protein